MHAEVGDQVRAGSRKTKRHGQQVKDSVALGFILSEFGAGVVTSLCKATANLPSTDAG